MSAPARHSRARLPAALALLACLAIAGCGQKGPLILPPPADPPVDDAVEDQNDEEEEAARDES